MPNRSVGAWIVRRALRSPDRLALRAADGSWTYRQLADDGLRLAARLRDAGIRHGDRVAYLGGPDPAYVRTLVAAGALGAAMVPVNAALSPEQVAYQLRDSGASVTVTAPGATKLAAAAANNLEVSVLADATAAEAEVRPIDAEALDVSLEDLALIVYTSGTTGRPKGVMLTHGNLTWSTFNVLASFDYATDDVALLVAPLHRMGSLAVALACWVKGATVGIGLPAEPEDVVRTVEAWRVTTVFSGPATFAALLDGTDESWPGWSRLRFCLAGGAPLPPELVRRYADRGVQLVQGYGLTEAGPLVLATERPDALVVGDATGTPVMLADVRLLAPDGSPVASGDAGEIAVRGPNVMAGYWHAPDATREAFADGWLRTGDVAREVAGGRFQVIDRLKELVPVGGENVYPAEVERVLDEHRAVAHSAVVADARSRLIAVVVLRSGAAATPDDLAAFAAERLAPYQRPHRILLVDELPLTAAGKVDKPRLAARFG